MGACNEHFTWPKILCQRFSGKKNDVFCLGVSQVFWGHNTRFVAGLIGMVSLEFASRLIT
jgi:hypothetical protein